MAWKGFLIESFKAIKPKGYLSWFWYLLLLPKHYIQYRMLMSIGRKKNSKSVLKDGDLDQI